MARTRNRTPEKDWKPKFLKELARTGCVLHSAAKAKVGRRTVYDRRQSDSEFAAKWDEAIEVANEHLEVEARRRAVEGTIEPIMYEGKVAARVRKYSDTLLIFLLKAHNPKFRGLDKVLVGGDPGNPMKHEHDVNITDRIDELAAAFAKAADREEAGPVSGNGTRESMDP